MFLIIRLARPTVLGKYKRQLWAYNTCEIIGGGHSPQPIISRVLYVFYTMVTQKYAIKSHLTSLLSNRNHSTIIISVY